MPEDVKVNVVDLEKATDPQEPVDVTPDAKPSEQDALIEKVKADFDKLYGSKLQQLESQFENFRHGAYRKQETLERELKEAKAVAEAAAKKAVTPTSSDDPWSTIQDGSRWKSEIERVADQKAEEKVKALQAQQLAQAQMERFKQVREQSIALVATKYPDLHPETGTSEGLVAQTYKKVIDSHPELFQDAYGPLAAMSLMEQELLKAAPNSATPSGGPAKPRVNPHLPPSRPAASGGERQTITREQKAFCDRHGIKYEDFLKNAAALEQGAVEA